MTDFEKALFSSLPSKPKHKFVLERFVAKGSKLERQPFELKDLERQGKSGTSIPAYVSWVVFNTNLNVGEGQLTHMYILGVLQNVALTQTVYPGWIPLVFLDRTSVDRFPDLHHRYVQKMFQADPSTLVLVVEWLTEIPNATSLSKRFHLPIKRWDDMAALIMTYKDKKHIKTTTKLQFNKTMWRFLPAACRVINISRDADSRINMREAYAAKEWVMSDYALQRIFDSVMFMNPILAGLWGSQPICEAVIDAKGVSCPTKTGLTPAIPDLVAILEGFFTPTNLDKGYGIDELFMGMETKGAEKIYNTNLMTFGYGSFFSSTDGEFTLFKNFQSIKLGNKLYSLLPCMGPNRPQDPTSLFYRLESGTLVGHDTSFVGENIVMDTKDLGWIELLTNLTVDYGQGKSLSTSWSSLFKAHGIKRRPKTFERHLLTLSIEKFTDVYGFDKRWLPHFWYVFDTALQAETFDFSRILTIVPSEYEVRVWEAAYREGVRKLPEVLKFVLREISNHSYEASFVEPLEALVHGETPHLPGHSPQTILFFKNVYKYIKTHSRVLKYLSDDEAVEYWFGALTYYPYSALRMWNLAF